MNDNKGTYTFVSVQTVANVIKRNTQNLSNVNNYVELIGINGNKAYDNVSPFISKSRINNNSDININSATMKNYISKQSKGIQKNAVTISSDTSKGLEDLKFSNSSSILELDDDFIKAHDNPNTENKVKFGEQAVTMSSSLAKLYSDDPLANKITKSIDIFKTVSDIYNEYKHPSLKK